jgi:hypothetical protein
MEVEPPHPTFFLMKVIIPVPYDAITLDSKEF